jgi:hypothetical protein
MNVSVFLEVAFMQGCTFAVLVLTSSSGWWFCFLFHGLALGQFFVQRLALAVSHKLGVFEFLIYKLSGGISHVLVR